MDRAIDRNTAIKSNPIRNSSDPAPVLTGSHFSTCSLLGLTLRRFVPDLNTEFLDLGFGHSGPMSAASRSKRMRTSFKHHQLRTMKSYFQVNHNPDAKDLKNLSQKTGLPKRVLQVSILGRSGSAFLPVGCPLIWKSYSLEHDTFSFSFSRLVRLNDEKVWFQNARAKWRRMTSKTEGKGCEKGDSSLDLDSYSQSPSYMLGPHSPNSIE